MRTFVWLFAMTAIAGLPLAATAQADSTGAAPDSHDPYVAREHGGFMIGFALGGGWVSVADCSICDTTGGAAFDASVGWFWNPRLALMFNVFALTTADAEILLSTGNAMTSFAVQFWATPELWVKGGLGYDTLMAATPFGAAETGGGGMTLGVGYEVFHGGGNFALDVSGRLSHANIQGIGLTNFAILVGVNWR